MKLTKAQKEFLIDKYDMDEWLEDYTLPMLEKEWEILELDYDEFYTHQLLVDGEFYDIYGSDILDGLDKVPENYEGEFRKYLGRWNELTEATGVEENTLTENTDTDFAVALGWAEQTIKQELNWIKKNLPGATQHKDIEEYEALRFIENLRDYIEEILLTTMLIIYKMN